MFKNKVLLIDDDKNFTDKFLKLINKKISNDQNYSIKVTNKSTDDIIKKELFDIYFLDIDMPDKSGFDIAKELNNRKDIYIIFVTNHNDLVYSCFEMKPFHFIRKDHLENDLEISMSMLKEQISKKSDKMIITYNQQKVVLFLKDIIYFEKMSNDLIIHSVSKEYKIRKSISLLDKELNSADFIRVHNSYVVNVKYIEKFNYKEITINDLLIPVSRSYVKIAKDLYFNYLRSL
jgi:DNA-binding LytR/AlgR family response regulator